MSSHQETLAELIRRTLPTKFDGVEDAGRRSGIPRSTWQNILLKDTQPTVQTLSKIAAVLGISESESLRAWHASRVARDLKRQTASGGAGSPAAAAKKRAKRGTRSTKRSPRRPAE